jgi:hypothetical protein
MKIIKNILTITSLFLLVSAANSQIEINLKKSFIESIKDKITLTLDYTLDNSNAKKIDLYTDFYLRRGQSEKHTKNSTDLIMSGRNGFVGFPVISKIFNAKTDLEAVEFVAGNKGNNINLSGVWRLWCNYLGNDTIIQGKNNEVLNDYNPKHIFEVTPVLKINEIYLKGFSEKINPHRVFNAETAIGNYSSAKCQIRINDSLITLTTQGIVYDYADFVLQVNGMPEVKDDGRIILCNVFDDDGNILFKNLRMLFIKDSEPEKTVRKLTKGEKIRVLGIPRIDLNEIDSRIKNSETNKEVLNGNLPFEMIILSVLNN